MAIGLAALLGLTGCLDLEEEVISGVTGSYFSTAEGAEAAVVGAYGVLRSYYGREPEIPLVQLGTDTWEKGGEAGSIAMYNDYNSQLAASMGEASLRNSWENLYFGVNTANSAVHYIEQAAGIPAPRKNVLLGEARFVRALFYFDLVRTWGDVHFTLEPSMGATTSASRTPMETIFAEGIVPDLQFAVEHLPLTQPQRGRATRGAAQTLLAEVYLTRGASGDYQQAEELTTAVISSGVYSLNDDFRSIFCGPQYPEACDFVPANEANPEFIFSVGYVGDGAIDQFGQQLHLLYVMAYDLQAHATPALSRRVEYGRPYRRAKPTRHLLRLWNRETDSRYNATFQTLWLHPNGDTAIYMPGTDQVPPEYQGKPYRVFAESQYTPVLFPTLRKWLDDERAQPNTYEGGRDRHIWRLGEVYLLRAEANIRQGQISEAVQDINVLRRRAAIPGKNNELTAAEIASLHADPIDFLLDERERELAGEEFRWYTLTRLGRLVERVRAYNPAGAANIQEYHTLRPIPQQQIDRTEGGATAFPQNPGY